MIGKVEFIYKTSYYGVLNKYANYFNSQHKKLYREIAEFDSIIIGNKCLQESNHKKWFIEDYKIEKRKSKKHRMGLVNIVNEMPHIDYSDNDDKLALSSKKNAIGIKSKISNMIYELHQEHLNQQMEDEEESQQQKNEKKLSYYYKRNSVHTQPNYSARKMSKSK